MNEPNPSVVRAIWERVMFWAVESGRVSEDPNAPEETGVSSSKFQVAGVCPKCGKGEVHVHPGGRMGGCVECHQKFKYPSMVEVG